MTRLVDLYQKKLDRIPKAGDKLTIDNVWLFVERSSVNRAESVYIKDTDG